MANKDFTVVVSNHDYSKAGLMKVNAPSAALANAMTVLLAKNVPGFWHAVATFPGHILPQFMSRFLVNTVYNWDTLSVLEREEVQFNANLLALD